MLIAVCSWATLCNRLETGVVAVPMKSLDFVVLLLI